MTDDDANVVAAAEEEPLHTSRDWPSWRYGPGEQAAIFNSPEEVPDGWETHPSLVKEPKVKAAKGDETNEFDKLTLPELQAACTERKIEFQEKWPRDKLISILKAA
jgi:hypothetical protein